MYRKPEWGYSCRGVIWVGKLFFGLKGRVLLYYCCCGDGGGWLWNFFDPGTPQQLGFNPPTSDAQLWRQKQPPHTHASRFHFFLIEFSNFSLFLSSIQLEVVVCRPLAVIEYFRPLYHPSAKIRTVCVRRFSLQTDVEGCCSLGYKRRLWWILEIRPPLSLRFSVLWNRNSQFIRCLWLLQRCNF